MKYITMMVTLLMSLLLTGCTSVPKNITPVRGFELNKYLGTWYEIVRANHSFEEGLTNVTATYSVRSDGGVKVVNRGYSPEDKEWSEAVGKAYFVESPDIGYLKVSFFGPFYGAYVIFELDKKSYQYAMIVGPNRDYFWILSRTPTMPDAIKTALLQKAKNMGFETDSFTQVDQSTRPQ